MAEKEADKLAQTAIESFQGYLVSQQHFDKLLLTLCTNVSKDCLSVVNTEGIL